MQFEIQTSGRFSIHSATIEQHDPKTLQQELGIFWSEMGRALNNLNFSHLRAELWADSGRIICYAVGKQGELRIGQMTFQVTIRQMAEEWLAIESLPSSEFDDAIDRLNHKYVMIAENARTDTLPDMEVRYFDADSEERLAN